MPWADTGELAPTNAATAAATRTNRFDIITSPVLTPTRQLPRRARCGAGTSIRLDGALAGTEVPAPHCRASPGPRLGREPSVAPHFSASRGLTFSASLGPTFQRDNAQRSDAGVSGRLSRHAQCGVGTSVPAGHAIRELKFRPHSASLSPSQVGMFDELRGGPVCTGRGARVADTSGPAADDQHLARRGPQRALEVAAEGLLELKARVQEQQLQLARKVHVALEVADVSVHGFLGREAVIQEPHLRALLVWQVARRL